MFIRHDRNWIALPEGETIVSHLLLIRSAPPRGGVNEDEEWRLWEVAASDVVDGTALIMPEYEQLSPIGDTPDGQRCLNIVGPAMEEYKAGRATANLPRIFRK